MKPGPIVGGVLIAAALAFGITAFVTNLTPYISFAEAKTMQNRVVQVMGKLDKSQPIVFNGTLSFTLQEEKTGEKLPVRFGKTKPASFEQAIQITAIGQWNGQYFEARNLLVKCPSKYQGAEGEEKSYAAR